jgi:RHS repeat-associated protein
MSQAQFRSFRRDRRNPKGFRRSRLRLEQLEPRQLLTDMWKGTTGGYWDTQMNWSDGVPTSTSDVVIGELDPGAFVTISSTVESIHSISASGLLDISGGGLTVAAKSTLSAGLTMTGGTLTASGSQVTLSVTGTTNVSSASLYAKAGATLSLPDLMSYAQANCCNATTLQASGPNSVLSLASVKTVSVTGALFAGVQVQATGGAHVDLGSANEFLGAVSVTSDGAGSQIDLSDLTEFSASPGSTANSGSLSITNKGAVVDPKLASLNAVNVTLDGTGTLAVSQWTTLTAGSIKATGGAYSFSGLTNIDSTSLDAEPGASLTMPAVQNYTDPSCCDNSAFLSVGPDSVLSMPILQAVAVTGAPSGGLQIQAKSGGNVAIPMVNELSGSVLLVADAAGSIVDLSSLETFIVQPAAQVNRGSLTITNHGTILEPKLTELNGVNVALDGTGILAIGQWASMTTGSLTISGGAYDFAALKNADASSVIAQSGANVMMPAVMSYSVGSGTAGTLEASGAGSVLALTGLTTLTLGGLSSSMQLDALSGGTLDLSAVAHATGPIQTSCLGATMKIAGATVSVPASGTGNIINIPQLPIAISLGIGTSGTLFGATFNVPQGDTAAITGGNYAGTTTFNVAQGASIDLTGGQTVTYSGTLSGSGPGTVQLSGGTLGVGVGGLTMDFQGSMFQWTGGGFAGVGRACSNTGVINLAGSNLKEIFADFVLKDFGTIVETGSGNFGLNGGDNLNTSTLQIEPGGTFLMKSDAGIANANDANVINNAGIIEKIGGTGTSPLGVVGPLNNTGTIEVDSGTLALGPTSIVQLSGNTLTGGTWVAGAGSTLLFPSGTNINTIQGNVTLAGPTATIAGIEILDAVSGSFALSNGASFATAGDLSNTGSLTVGAGSTLSVEGDYTQAASGSLTIGLGGASSGNQYGQLAITGSAALAGSVNAITANGFTPTAGDSFPIMKYGSQTGADSLSFTGINSGAISILKPDIGKLGTALSTVTSPANLVVQPFSVTANAVVGQNLTVTYDVKNKSDNAANETWTDSVYLSTQETLNASAVLLGRVKQDGVVANGEYSQTLTAAVPGLLPDNYYVVVIADSQGLVPELNRTNTELASTDPVQVTVPTLVLGGSESGSIESGQNVYYALTVQAGQDIAISASLVALQSGELYVAYQTIPTSSTFLAASTSSTQTEQQVVIPNTQAGTYYILLAGDSGSGTGMHFTLSSKSLPLQVTSVSPAQAGNSGTTTITIHGAEFTAGTMVSLLPDGQGGPMASTQVTFQDSTTLFAQFNLAGAAPGKYDVAVTSGGQHATDPSAFTVTGNAKPGHISYNLSVPSVSRAFRPADLTLTYTNDGGSDALAPIFVISVTSNNAEIGMPGETSFSGSSVQILGIENAGPAGTLPPGVQNTIEIPYESTTLAPHVGIDFSVQVLTGDSTPMNWSSLKSSLQPSYMNDTAWNAVFANLTAQFGSTTESYLSYLDNEATYLSQLGEYTDDVQRLFGFAINTANDALTSGSIDSVTDASYPDPGGIPLDFVRQFNASISGRDTMGPFGLGWTDNWHVSASADSQGNVTISDDGSLLFFTKNVDDTYTPAPGEYGALSLSSGAYQYVETDGTIIAFIADGSLNYEQDTNGNRITAGYSSGELSSLTASNGSRITIAYNTQGLISSITDPGGQTTSYGYDAGGLHLLTFTDVFGKTTYTYATGPTPAVADALTSLRFADGTGIEWSYDAQGRTLTTGRLNGTDPEAEVESYAYPAPGEYKVTNADGDKTATFNDDRGNLGETIDGLRNITRFAYDANNNLTKFIAADGTSTTYSYDVNGNMTSETDPLGHTISFTYNSLAEPLTFVNQEGYTTTYQYDPNGNLLETSNPDGTTQQYAYNLLGEVTSSTDPDGQNITYAYKADGQLATENLPDGTSNTYTYDGHGNMLMADGPGGNWSFTYNSQNLPTSIAEPFGTLTVSYGVDGNITQIIDQTGFTVNYGYDPVGRLSNLTDTNGNLIESYAYDPNGNLASETKGNGTSTTYNYNADGDVTGITNVAPGGAANSQMAYDYNAVGEVTSMLTGGVTTAYEYDADGELVSASSPGDKLLYAYDPGGNRTSSTDNGVVTNYVSNNVNEYMSSTTNGVTTTYRYDGNGNLIGATTGGQTTAYTFDALNQLTGVSGPNGTFSYTYDPLGYQIASNANGQTTDNLIDPFGLGNVAAQFDSSGNLVAHFTYGLGLVNQVSANGSESYYDFNLQGSTVGVTNSAGAYINQYSYDPFGQVTTINTGIANPFTFVGVYGVSSGGNGLFYMRARFYDTSTGQFAANDPLGVGGGDSNERRYADDDPIIMVDPLGLQSVEVPCPDKQPPEKYKPPDWLVQFLRAWQALKYIASFGKEGSLSERPRAPAPAPVPAPAAHPAPAPPPASGPAPSPTPVPKDDSNNASGCNHCNPPPPASQPNPPTPPGAPGPTPPPSNNLTALDPNDLVGPSGFGPAGYLTTGGALLYTIEFSNETTAEVPADNVVITEQLSPNLDWTTFQLGTIGFGGYTVNVPSGLTSHRTRVDATATLGVYVDINANVNLITGLLTVTFTSLDPQTLDTPSNPLVGFLPPDKNPPNGEGYINYTIQPKAGLATGATVNAQASIVFDTNAAIATPQITNTIDSSAPTSTVGALPASTTNPTFLVSWSGSDGLGSGIGSYDIYVSDDGGAYSLWQSDTTKTSATYAGQSHHTYRFDSVATDNVGLMQPAPSSAEGTIEVLSPAPPPQPPPPPPPPPPSPPLVTVLNVIDKLNKKHQVTEVDVIFSGAVNPTEAANVATYRLATPGKKNSYTAKNAGVIRPKSARYIPSTNTIALTPKKPFALTKPVQVLVYGTGPTALQDAAGRPIDGDQNGTPGGNAIAIISKKGVVAQAATVARARPSTQGSATELIDALITRALAEIIRTHRTKPGTSQSRR